MKEKLVKVILFMFLNSILLSCKAQTVISEKFNYYKIDLKSIETKTTNLMRNNYRKEFYANKDLTIYKNQKGEMLELFFFYKNGKFEKHLFKNKEYFILRDFKYIDDNLNELTDFQKEDLKKMFEIKENDLKKINENDCVKIVLKKPNVEDYIEMYVSKDIPNLPNHFPVPSNVYNGESLEIKLFILSEHIEFGVTEFIKNVSIEEHLGVKFTNPKEISESKYLKLTE